MKKNMQKKLLLLLVAMAFFMTTIGAATAAENDTTLTLTSSDPDNNINLGDSVTLTAYLQAEDEDGNLYAVTGEPVNFQLDYTTIATVNTGNGVNAGYATYTYTPSTHGDKVLQVTYAGRSDPPGPGTALNPTTSNQVILTVNAYNPFSGIFPVADDDAVTNAVEETPFTGGVAGNDLLGSGINTWAVTAQPLYGTVVMKPLDGTYSYTPTVSDYFGTDSFTYTLTAFDGTTTRTDTALVTITIANVQDAPVAADDAISTSEDTSVVVPVLANDSDVDSDTLTVTSVTQPTNGQVTLVAGVVTYIPTSDWNGVDSFTYTIGDGNGGSATATVTVTVNAVNDDPVASDDSDSTNEDTPVTINVINNDTDLEGDTLTVSGVTQPANGSVVNNGDGTVTYTPNSDWNGVDSFTYTIGDGNGGSATATVTVTVNAVNDDPVAVDNTVTAPEDIPAGYDVLGDDSDVDGDSLTIIGVTQPSNGQAVNHGTYVEYIPNSNYNGPDQFTYTISDGNGGTATATVFMTVIPSNDDPVAVDDTANTNEDTPVTINVLANDSDVEGDTLSVTGVTQPANGSVVINSDGTVTYTPNSNFNGVDTFTYTVSDGDEGDIGTVTVNVASVPDADLVLTKTVNNAAPVVKDTVIFTLIVNNNGPETAVDVTVNDKLPAGLTYVSSVANFGTYDPTTGLWTIASLPNGASAVLTITSVVEQSGQIINQANVTALSWDPNLEGNAASAAINAQAASETGTDNEPEVNAKTVAMQKTGAPIAALVLAFFMLLGGMVLPKRK